MRRLLELGVQVVTGDTSFRIFQDVDGIEFGEQWQKKLDRVISGATFLIPILTPLFFRSDACRDELKKFMQHEKELGRDDLILPIYFVTTPLLEKDDLCRADSLASEISRRQRYDWRDEADLPANDPQVRRAIKDLSAKIDNALQRTHSPTDRADLRFNDQQLDAASHKFRKEADLARCRPHHRQILWIDDRPDNNIFERRAMESYNIEFVLAKSTNEALDKITERHFDAVISDMGRPPDRRAGYTLLEALRTRGYGMPYFIYARSRSPEHVAEALGHGAQGTTNVADELIAMVLSGLEGATRTEGQMA
jgi:CheY-like chemotaxis protein